MPDVASPDPPVYEMLWDCRFCGTKKLLGLTHRHCPSCGGPQNAEERYFPSDAEKVPVQSHEYFGADVVCASCGVANGKRCKHCGGCGAPLEGGRDVARRQDELVGGGASYAGQTAQNARAERRGEGAHATTSAAPTSSPSRTRLILGAVLLVVIVLAGLAATALLWKREGTFEVTRHTWKREIAVEQLGPVASSAWCDAVPVDARGITRHREVRSHERVANGEDCHTRKVDNGNGTFSEHQECTTRYRDEPVYADKCSYTVDRWRQVRAATAEGASVADAPRWPATALVRAGSCLGCEREGTRTETYTVVLRDSAAKEHSCDFTPEQWGAFADGTKWKGDIRVLGGGVDCGSLGLVAQIR